jgi:hypothetical protein
MTKITPFPLSIPFSQGFRCEAVPSNDHAAAHGNATREAAGDPATLIGLALSFARQGPLFDGAVPPLILERLGTHARHGNPACRMVLDWIDRHRKVEAEAVIADQRAYRVHDDAATDHHAADQIQDEVGNANPPAWQIQGEVSSLGNAAEIADLADIADVDEDGDRIPVCGIGSPSPRDLVLSERIVSHALIEPKPNRTAKADANANLNPDPKWRAELHPKRHAGQSLKPKPDTKPGTSLKSGLRRHKHRPIAEIISATMVKANEEMSHG